MLHYKLIFILTEDSTRMKIYIHGVVDPKTVIKVLSAMVMEIMKMNYEIVLDNVGLGSVILYITVLNKATTEEKRFLSQLESFLLYIIDKGKIDFRFPGNIAVVVVISDPLIDHCKFLYICKVPMLPFRLNQFIVSMFSDSSTTEINACNDKKLCINILLKFMIHTVFMLVWKIKNNILSWFLNMKATNICII